MITSETRPLPAVTLTEVLATSDVPGGVVNVLTGFKRELVPVLAGHVDVDAIDLQRDRRRRFARGRAEIDGRIGIVQAQHQGSPAVGLRGRPKSSG